MRWIEYKSIIMLVFSLLLSALLLEALLTLFGRFPPNPRYAVGELENRESKNFVADPLVGWRMRPSHSFDWPHPEWHGIYRSNRHGFRSDSDFVDETGLHNILVSGDSFTFGTGVNIEETYGALIDQALPNSIVQNIAMPGFGIDQIWMSIRRFGLQLNPELVIVGFIDNDFDRSLTAYRIVEGMNKPVFKLLDGQLVPKLREDFPAPQVRFLEWNSRLWALGRRSVEIIGRRLPIGEWWTLNAAILDQMRRDVESRDIPILFVRIPSKSWKSFPLLKSFMYSSGANFIDLRDRFDSLPSHFYFVRDGHMNVSGHEYLADIVTSWIREHVPEL